MRLMANARAETPASLKRFLDGRLRMMFTNPIVMNIGTQIRHAKKDSKKTVFIVISPFHLFLMMLK